MFMKSLFLVLATAALSVSAPVVEQAGIEKDIIKVACIGDSITQGIGTSNGELYSYPAQLQSLLGSDYEVTNYGHSGTFLQKAGDNPYGATPYTQSDRFNASLESEPDIVLIMLGTNDTIPGIWNAYNYENELEDFIHTYQNISNTPVVYIMKCPPVYHNLSDLQNMATVFDEINPIIERVAEKTDTEIIDIFSALYDKPELFGDGLHPNDEGARVIAETVYDVLK